MDAFERLEVLKLERNAVVLAHYYQEPDIQDAADFVGDSLELSRRAAETDADIIVFAGVHFMAETAKIINPNKVVLLPDLNAGCSLADACTPKKLGALKAKFPDHAVVSYINCSAEIKAMSDVICTSSNAVDIVELFPADRPIIFAPDKNLGAYVQSKTGREMVLYDGTCQVHELFSEKKLVQLMVRHPGALVIAHPECEPQVLQHAHHIGSTSSLLSFVERSDNETFIVLTEAGILYEMSKRAPAKLLIPGPPANNCACNDCPHMKLNTLEKLVACLETLSPQIEMTPALIEAAELPIRRMLARDLGV